MRAVAALGRALDAVSNTLGRVVMWLAVLLVLVQFAVVLLRYGFSTSLIQMQEGVIYLHATLFMLGIAYTMLHEGHVRVDILYARLTPRGKAWIDVAGHLLFLAPSLVVILLWSWPMVRRSWAILEGPISVGGIPASFLLKSLVPAFCVLLLIQGFSALVRDLARLMERSDVA